MFFDAGNSLAVILQLIVMLRGTVTENAAEIVDKLLSFDIEMAENALLLSLHLLRHVIHDTLLPHIYLFDQALLQTLRIILRERR